MYFVYGKVRKFHSKIFKLLHRSIPPNDENVTSMQQILNEARRTHFYRDTILPKIALRNRKSIKSIFYSPKYIDQDESPLHRVRNTDKCAPAHELRSKPRRSRMGRGSTGSTHSTSALITYDWLASRPRTFYPWDNSSCSKLDRPHCRSGRRGEKNCSCWDQTLIPPVVQPEI